MRREKKESLKYQLIADIKKYIAIGNHKLVDLDEMSEKLVKFYFPKASIFFVNTFKLLARAFNEEHLTNYEFNSLLKFYK